MRQALKSAFNPPVILIFQVFNVKASTFLFHLLLQPISIYCNGVVAQQVQGLDEGRSSQLYEGLHDTCGFVVSNTVLASDKQVILALLAGDGHGVGSTHFGQDDPQRFPRAEL